MILADLTWPNLPNIMSRSSSCVTGFSLHTNNVLAGGSTSAVGMSPIVSKNIAELWASFLRLPSSSIGSLSFGDWFDISSTRPTISSNGSCKTVVCFILISTYGL
ncbi:hypothetical protein KC19_9G120800 [Ceratodon purpureus]|uniref:Uncharacterized protein n=1 Tax=Ceratodon purpureus TaxID=3225 RepID=A0A8T0GWN6_CERPU|nr:hypothetical protein KC19_9G120800 [Ceratodon purpureus]